MSPVKPLVLQSAPPTLALLAQGLVARLLAWQSKAKTRRNLGRLDARLLQDIGIDHASAQHEAAQPFWRD